MGGTGENGAALVTIEMVDGEETFGAHMAPEVALGAGANLIVQAVMSAVLNSMHNELTGVGWGDDESERFAGLVLLNAYAALGGMQQLPIQFPYEPPSEEDKHGGNPDL